MRVRGQRSTTWGGIFLNLLSSLQSARHELSCWAGSILNFLLKLASVVLLADPEDISTFPVYDCLWISFFPNNDVTAAEKSWMRSSHSLQQFLKYVLRDTKEEVTDWHLLLQMIFCVCRRTTWRLTNILWQIIVSVIAISDIFYFPAALLIIKLDFPTADTWVQFTVGCNWSWQWRFCNITCCIMIKWSPSKCLCLHLIDLWYSSNMSFYESVSSCELSSSFM